MATRGQKLITAGSVALIAEPALALAHQGGLGVIIGLAAGAVAYCAVDDLERVTGRQLPRPAARTANNHQERGKPSLAYRLFNGKSMRHETDQGDAEEIARQVEELERHYFDRAPVIDLARNLQIPLADVAGKAI